VALFSFLLNFVWEMWQIPFYEGGLSVAHVTAIVACTRATLGDVVIALCAFGTAAAIRRSRDWILNPRLRDWGVYLTIGLLITIALEYIGVEILGRWSYTAHMPRMPGLGTGLLPIVQWIMIPGLGVPLAARQLPGARTLGTDPRRDPTS